LRQMAEILTKDVSVLNFDHIHAVEGLVSSSGAGAVDLPQGLRAFKTAKFLELSHV